VVIAPAVQLERLGKRYGRVTALRDLSLEVATGEVFGFLGLNGAGKTTTIRILLDLVRPTTGRAAVFGIDCQTRGLEVRAKLGYLPGEPGFYGDTTGEATLDLLASLSGGTVDRERRTALLDRLELSTADLRRPIREYSTGMKRKLGIVQAFQGDPPLLVLDEPTEGLDPLMQDAFYGLLADARSRGRTVFMSSHVLPEVERVCDRIGLVRGGELVLVSTVHEIRSLAGRRVRVSFAQPVAAPASWPSGCEVIEVSPRLWDLRVHGALGAVVAMLVSLPIADLEVQMPHLEEILKTYYADEAHGTYVRLAHS
jgi:ABC-2 type transport system ATP-binding protein